jgi:hemerythrin-like domain-containing protein
VSSFFELEAYHSQLDELFAQHQEALVERDVDVARQTLRRYHQGLQIHMDDEENVVLPLLEQLEPVPGGSPKMFRDEHRKLSELLGVLLQQVEALDPETLTPRRVVELLDEEHRYKGLVEHHHLREHNLLFPRLDAETPEEDRQEALQRCRLQIDM